VARLEDPVADLVRKDALFAKLGLDAADYTEPAAVIDLILEHKALMQRPVIVSGGRAIIGRPTARVSELLAD
jgi:arsenate reductase